jgi:hypothetical protein
MLVLTPVAPPCDSARKERLQIGVGTIYGGTKMT